MRDRRRSDPAARKERGQDDEILRLCGEIAALERDADRAYREALGEFLNGHDLQEGGGSGPSDTTEIRVDGRLDLVEILKRHDLLGGIEAAADRCGRISEALQTLVTEYA